jgi:recombination protein RecA
MAKEAKKAEIKMTFSERAAELQKRFAKEERQKIVIPTGSIALDKAFGGGYCTGRIYEYISWEGAGKTSLCLHAIAEAQKIGINVAYIDAEHALDEKYARTIGVDWDALGESLFQPMNGEEGFEDIKELIRTGEPSLIVVDSTSGMKPKKEMEDPAGSTNMGLHARLMGAEIPKIVSLADVNNCCVIFVSQFREKIGVMFGSPETTQGGNALKFWASVRTELRRELSKEGDEVYGIISKFKVIKNKMSAPYQTGKIPIVFGQGIDKLKEIITLGKEYELLTTRTDTLTFGKDKYKVEEFKELLNSNEEFYNDVKASIINKMKEE